MRTFTTRKDAASYVNDVAGAWLHTVDAAQRESVKTGLVDWAWTHQAEALGDGPEMHREFTRLYEIAYRR